MFWSQVGIQLCVDTAIKALDLDDPYMEVPEGLRVMSHILQTELAVILDPDARKNFNKKLQAPLSLPSIATCSLSFSSLRLSS